MIIAIDGACPGNGSDQAAKSACGIHFGDGARNYALRVREKSGYTHTSQRAELHAAIAALDLATVYAINGGQSDCDLNQCPTPCRVVNLVIKSDSAYLVNSMTRDIHKWRTNGWMTAKKTAVKNKDLFVQIWNQVDKLEKMLTAVDFWLVPRDLNADADELANEGLNSSEITGY